MTDERFVRTSLRFEPPGDAFERLTRRRGRAVRNRRIGAAAMAFLIVALIGAAVIRALPPPVSPVDDATTTPVTRVTPSPPSLTEPPFMFWDDGGGRFVGTVTVQESGCSLDLVDGPVPTPTRNARKIHIGFRNDTSSTVVFDVGRIADGHTFEELAEDVGEMRGEVQRDGIPMVAGDRGTPVTGILRYFVGRPPSFEFVQPAWVDAGGMLGGGRLLSGVGSTTLWNSSWTGGWVGPPSGTYAVICYAPAPGTEDLVPVGVAGPIIVSEVLESP